jgi:hypothetical protein
MSVSRSRIGLFAAWAVVCGAGAGRLAAQGVELRGVTRGPAGITLSFDALPGVTYRMERKFSLDEINWQVLPSVSDFTAPASAIAQFTDGDAATRGRAFYRVRQTAPYDLGLASNSAAPLDYAKAIELCDTATEASGAPGVISAAFTLASGSGTPNAVSRSIRQAFGTSPDNVPRAGFSMVVLSTGAAAGKGHTNPGFQAFQDGANTNTSSAAPADWLIANGNRFPNPPGCPEPASLMANNPVMLTLRIRTPAFANSFRVSAKYFTSEYPEWVCSPYNDLFVALLDSAYAGPNPNPTDKNIATYSASRIPLSAHLTGVGLFTQCLSGPTGCAQGAIAGTNPFGTGLSGIAGTGMDDTPPAGPNASCGTNNKVGGGTDWLVMRGNVVPGEIITLRFAIWDTSDSLYDSLVLLDNFQWLSQTITPGMTLQ